MSSRLPDGPRRPAAPHLDTTTRCWPPLPSPWSTSYACSRRGCHSMSAQGRVSLAGRAPAESETYERLDRKAVRRRYPELWEKISYS